MFGRSSGVPRGRLIDRATVSEWSLTAPFPDVFEAKLVLIFMSISSRFARRPDRFLRRGASRVDIDNESNQVT